jgi:hypothetical protein
MNLILAIALSATIQPDMSQCRTFTDGNRIFDFEFHGNEIYGEQCRIACEEGQCTFYCETHTTTVFDTQPPMAVDMTTGKISFLEPLCQ